MISVDDLYEWCLSNVSPDLEWGYFLAFLLIGAAEAYYEFGLFADNDDTEYVVHKNLLEDFYLDDDEEADEETRGLESYRKHLIERHSDLKRRDYSTEEVLEEGCPIEQYMDSPIIDDLRDLLIAKTPKGKNEYFFSQVIIEELYDVIRKDVSTDSVMRLLEDHGLSESLIFSSGLLEIINELYERTPTWENNGWTIVELEQDIDFILPDGSVAADFKTAYERLTNEMGNQEPVVVEKLVPITSIKIGRNEPCPCGSGRKYKRCCGTAAL